MEKLATPPQDAGSSSPLGLSPLAVDTHPTGNQSPLHAYDHRSDVLVLELI